MQPLKVFVIAGEESGDILAGAIVSALARASSRPLEIRGIGGETLKVAGLKDSLIPMHALAVMGIIEIFPKLPFILRSIKHTVRAAEEFQPDLVLSVDSPDFSFRVQKRLKARGCLGSSARQIHVVAPSVWAWRPGRAQKISKFLDGLVCLFPFEPPYFERHGLKAVVMGHPAVNAPLAWVDPAPLRRALDLTPQNLTLGLYLGSRAGVIERHAPVFIEAVNRLAQKYPDLCVLIPTFPKYAERIRSLCDHLAVRHYVMSDPLLKPLAMRACDAALAVSGTVGLELAVAGVPHVIGYKMSDLSWAIAHRLVKSGQFAHLVNIIEGRAVVPEYIQDSCTPAALANALADLMDHSEKAAAQKQAFSDVRRKIGEGAPERPADIAARFILSTLEKAACKIESEMRGRS